MVVCTEQASKRVPLKLEQQLTIVKLQMFNNFFNEADEEQKGGVTKTQFRQAVRDTIGEHVTDLDADMVFMKVDTFDAGIISWEVCLWEIERIEKGFYRRVFPRSRPLRRVHLSVARNSV